MRNSSLAQFVDGIFALNTRRFGTVAEIMIKKMFDLEESATKLYDLYDANKDLRIEVKFSRVMREYEDKIREDNVIEQCIESSVLENRSLGINETEYNRFDCNIQQIKREQFDILFYGLFYIDCIEIFCSDTKDIELIPGYSDYQHYGNKGEGQFHINNNSLPYHRQNHFNAVIKYTDLFDLFNS